jgi:hypothetical protein
MSYNGTNLKVGKFGITSDRRALALGASQSVIRSTYAEHEKTSAINVESEEVKREPS